MRAPDPRGDAGFTIVELMVVVAVIGILVSVALPTYLGARQRANDRAAQSDLRQALSTAKVLYGDDVSYAPGGVPITSAMMQAEEPSLVFVTGATASSAGNGYAVSFRVWDATEINVARRSSSGRCYYARTIETQGVAPTDVPGVYYGFKSAGPCTGDSTATMATLAANFPGW